MKIRHKISYSASLKGMTVPELIYNKILDTMQLVKEAGRDDFDMDEDKKFEELFPKSWNELTLNPKVFILSSFIDQITKREKTAEEPKPIKSENYLRNLTSKNNVLDIFHDIENPSDECVESDDYHRFLRFKWIMKSR